MNLLQIFLSRNNSAISAIDLGKENLAQGHYHHSRIEKEETEKERTSEEYSSEKKKNWCKEHENRTP